MPRYVYEKLIVFCRQSVEFRPDDLRGAVEYLRAVPNPFPTKSWVGLIAQVDVRAGQYWLRAKVLLTLDEIRGKTPVQVWDRFDEMVDEDRASLIRRG